MFFDLDTPINANEFGRIEQPCGFWHKSWSRHEFLLFYLVSGDLVMLVDGKKYDLTSGDTLIITPGTSYQPLDSSGCTYYHFFFSARLCDEYKSEFAIRDSHCHSANNFTYSYTFSDRTVIEVKPLTHSTEDSRLGKIFNRCAELDLWKRPFEKALLDNYLKEILIQLSFVRETSSTVDKPFIRMTNFINAHYYRNIGLAEVASEAHLSPSYAAKLFKRNSGIRCCDYINNVRLAVARGLLINTAKPIATIADEVGYKSQYYFARQFKKFYGTTALQYRKKGVEPTEV